ncbi:MAG: threonine synthase [Oscillospiraceae bacterium]|nr:threonine synthase [Oscillospiraceae bacterium]
MRYISTRGEAPPAEAPAAILRGLAPDGGLYCPEGFPALTPERLAAMSKMTYTQRSAEILGLFLNDFTLEELSAACETAYLDFPVPVRAVDDKISVLELWHGPTCAFKDIALQILPELMSLSAKKLSDGRRFHILVATSGDTGKAALEGFKDRAGFSVLVFYPKDGVSNTQKLQMTTQAGENVCVCAVNGSFDDAQTGVKEIFTDAGVNKALAENNIVLSSANSINLGRLLPQVAYYVSAYCDMVGNGTLSAGRKLDITVPTGNFGNILAANYAKMIGLPVGRLICASNSNNVLADFLATGVYDRRRKLRLTSSPSMDILVSSNFERALFHLSGGDAELVRALMSKLSADGIYTAPAALKRAFDGELTGGWCDEKRVSETIKSVWEQDGYLLDPHTAVAAAVARENLTENPMLIVATASPFKFTESVCAALGAEGDTLEALETAAKQTAPGPLRNLGAKAVRFTSVTEKSGMKEWMLDRLVD